MFTVLTVLGSGTILRTAVPGESRACAGYLLEVTDDTGGAAGPARPILLDCGPGSLLRLGQAGVPAGAIDRILITHFHPDHVSDLPPLLMSRWLEAETDPAGAAGRRARITVVGPPGLRDWFRWLDAQYGSWLADLQPELVEIPASGTRLGRMRIDSRPTGHTENSVCYRLTDEAGAVLFYSGDTGYREELVPLARGADIAVLECSWPESRGERDHLSPVTAGRLAREAGVGRLVLSHFYPAVLEQDILAEAGRQYSGPIELAEDLRRIPFRADQAAGIR